jgi:hypothetical protein
VFHVPSSAKEEPKVIEYAPGVWGGITASGADDVKGMIVTNNIVSGTWHHGFHFTPQKCDDDNPPYTFLNNIAHSISGYGAIAENVKNECTLVKDFTAYKTTEASIMLGGPSKLNKGENLRSNTNRYGIAVHPGRGTSRLLNSFSYAEYLDNEDCPYPEEECDHCLPRGGVMVPLGAKGPNGSQHRDSRKESDRLPLF